MNNSDNSTVPSNWSLHVTMESTMSTEPPIQLDRPIIFTWADICKVIMGIVGIVGNGLVILTVFKTPKLKTLTNVFIVSLAIADLITSIFIIPYPLNGVPDGFLGELTCRIYVSGFLLWLNFDASTFNLMAVTIERYIAIVHPVVYKTHFTKSKIKIMVIAVWLLSIIPQSFCLYIWKYDYELHDCKLEWPGTAEFQLFVGVGLFLSTYFIPLILMFIVYTRIMLVLKKRAKELKDNKQNNPALSLLRARANVVKMLLIVVITFGVCWAPDQFMFLGYNFGMYVDFSSIYYRLIILVAFCNSAMNPFIYAFKNKSFRNGFKNLLWRRSTAVVGTESGTATTKTQTTAVTSVAPRQQADDVETMA